jgi:hypothetical protein
MKYILILVFAGLLFNCGRRETKDPVDYYDRFDLANTVDTTTGAYNPKVDSTYIFPADSSDVVRIKDTLGYIFKMTVFPIRNKYIVLFKESSNRREKVKYREYKLQIEITNMDGLKIKKVISKYDFPDSTLMPSPRHYFIRGAKFRQIENNEFVFDVDLNCPFDDGCFFSDIKCFIDSVDGVRFENHANRTYDSTLNNQGLQILN